MNPYIDKKLDDGVIFRKFSNDSPEHHFVWHRDLEDREIWIDGETDWLIQFDNKLPQKISGKIFIKSGVYHRLLKGSGDLNIYIKKL
jgi:hypothetical protein